MKRRFTVIALKTTGSDADRDEVFDYGAVRVVDGQPGECFSRLARPAVPVPPHVVALTGVSNKDLAGHEASAVVRAEFCEFISGETVVLHGADLARDFLGWSGEVFDSAELSEIVLPALEHHDLETVIEYLGLDSEQLRRAEAEAVATLDVWNRLLDELSNYPLAVLQAVNRLIEPIDWSLKDVFADVERTKVRDVTDAVQKDITDVLEDFGELIKSARNTSERERPERIRQLDLDRIAEVFDADGPLAGALGVYEHRPQQAQMARAVADAYNGCKHAMIEAGTGTGKSLAYLVPSICWAKLNREQIVISTNTKNLQEQLFGKDIPLVRRVLDQDFTAAMIKGRPNYVCLRKLRYLLAESRRELTDGDRLALLPLVTWISKTRSGDISENTAFGRRRRAGLWDRLYSTGTECFGRACPNFRKCFLAKARAMSLTCDIVIANHAVVFSEMGLPPIVLPEYRRLIFDEAHNIENVATEHLGCRVDRRRFAALLDRLHRKSRTAAGRGLLANIGFRLRLGRKPAADEKQLIEAVGQCGDAVTAVRSEAQVFLGSLAGAFPKLTDERVRYRAEDRAEQAWSTIMEHKQKLVGIFGDLIRRLKRIHDSLDGMGENRDFRYRFDFVRELAARVEVAEELARDIEFVVAGDDDNFVYWVERDESVGSYAAAAAPIDISRIMFQSFYDPKDSIVFTSATLTVNGRFDFINGRIGTALVDPSRLIECDLGTSFDYDRQVLLCVPTFLPEPGVNNGEFERQLAELLIDLHVASEGRGLVLFTSYGMMNAVYPEVREGLAREGLPVLGQGIDGGRDQLTSIFRRVVQSVLLGTHSFWEGIDIPGQALSCLTIAKLPFAVFTDPVVEARCEAVEQAGQNAFTHYSVPAAVIRLKQGFGRLIRHRNDRGVIVVCDRRIVTRRYGRQFLHSLPARHQVFARKDGLIRAVEKFLETSLGSDES